MSNVLHILDFIRILLSTVANATLYGTEHPQVTRLSKQAFEHLTSALEIRHGFSVLIVENELVIDGQPCDGNLFLQRFTHILATRGIGSLKFLPGIQRSEVDAFVSGLARHQSSESHVMASSDHLRLGHVDVRSSSDDQMAAEPVINSTEPVARSLSLPDLSRLELGRFIDVYEAVKNGRHFKISGINEAVSGFINFFHQEGRPLLEIAILRDVDEYTFTHSANVCILNLAQAMALGIDGPLLNDIGLAAMMHDIGKLYVPEEILTKKDKLTDEEFTIMKQHPVKGARHLLTNPGVPRLAVTAAYEHHLKYNLSGYPRVSVDWQQNLCSHMTMISDFFDALRTRRSYREPMELQEISTIMTGMMGTDLHPALTGNFLQIISGLTSATKSG
ncbi:MAG TPA: HD domain-containing protein [Desulfuromonadales bacterium]|nr:HD domain-containing protein [Desulfuromonadales bacterium]